MPDRNRPTGKWRDRRRCSAFRRFEAELREVASLTWAWKRRTIASTELGMPRARFTRLVEVGEDHRELVAADAADAVVRADHRVEQPDRLAEDDVARLVTVLVVVVFEVVDVEDHHGHRAASLPGLFDLLLEESLVSSADSRSP